MVQKAKELCEDLITSVKEQYEDFKSRPPRNYGDRHGGDRYGGDRYNDRGHSHGRPHRDSPGGSHRGGSYDQSQGGSYQGYGNFSSGQAQPNSPASGAAPSQPAASNDYAAQWAQYYGGQDPYAAYGGYAA